MGDSVFRIVLDNSDAVAAMEKAVKGAQDYEQVVNKANEAAEKGAKKLAKNWEAAFKAEADYHKFTTNATKDRYEKTLQEVQAQEKLVAGLKAAQGQFKGMAEDHQKYTAQLKQYGFEQQANELAKLTGQLSAFSTEKEKEIILDRQRLKLKKSLAQSSVLASSEGKELAAQNAQTKELIASEMKLHTIRAQSNDDVLANTIAATNAQHQLNEKLQVATAAVKAQSSVQIKLAEARARDTDEIRAAILETNELNEKNRQATKILTTQEKVLKDLRASLGKGVSLRVGDDALKDFAKLQTLAKKFYDTNDGEMKELVSKFKHLSAEMESAFKSGKGTSDYQAQLQVLTKEMEKLSVKSAKTALGLDKVGKEAIGAAGGLSKLEKRTRSTSTAFTKLNLTASISRSIFDGLGRHISVYGANMLGVAAVTYGATRAVREAITTYVEFTDKLQRASAVMGASIAQTADMGSHARDLAKTTIFTAVETAEALVQLGMSGLNTVESMEALEPTLQIASIGALDFGTAADIATNIMHGFALGAEDITRIVDVMAVAITSSNATMQQMGNTISYVAPVASSFGISLEAVAASAEVLHNSGIKASRAGTGLRRTFLKLYNPTAAGADALERLGVSALDMYGNTRPVIDVLEELSTAVDAGKGSIIDLAEIVGVRASSAFISLVKSAKTGAVSVGEFEEGLSKLSAETGATVSELRKLYEANLDAAGAAAKMQDVIEDTLGADWKKLISAANELGIGLVEAFGDDIREGIQGLTETLLELTEHTGDIRDLAVAVMEAAEAFDLFAGAKVGADFGAGLIDWVSAVAEVGASLIGLDKASEAIGGLEEDTGKLGTAIKLVKVTAEGGMGTGTMIAATELLKLGTTKLVEALGLRQQKQDELRDSAAVVSSSEIAANTALLQVTEEIAASEAALIELRKEASEAGGKIEGYTDQIAELEALQKHFQGLNQGTNAYKAQLEDVASKLEGVNNQLDFAIHNRNSLNEQATNAINNLSIAEVQKELETLLEMQRAGPEAIVRMQEEMAKASERIGMDAAMVKYQSEIDAAQDRQAALTGLISDTRAELNRLSAAGAEATNAVNEAGVAMVSGLQNAVIEIGVAFSKFDMEKLVSDMPRSELKGLESGFRGVREEYEKLSKAGLEEADIYASMSAGSKELVDRMKEEKGLLDQVISQLGKKPAASKRAAKATKDHAAEIAKLNDAMLELTSPEVDLTPQQELTAVTAEYHDIMAELLPLVEQVNAAQRGSEAQYSRIASLQSDLNDVRGEQKTLLADINAAEETQQKRIVDLSKKYSKSIKAQSDYNDQVAELKELMVAMPEHTQVWMASLQELNDELSDAPVSAFTEQLMEFGQAFEKLDEASAQWLDNFSDTMTDFIIDGEADFEGFFKGIQRDLTKMSVQKMIFDVGAVLDTATGGDLFGGLTDMMASDQQKDLKVQNLQLTTQEQMLAQLKRISGEKGSGGLDSIAGNIADKFIKYSTTAGGVSELFSTSTAAEMATVSADFVKATDTLVDAGASMEQAAMLAEQTAEFGQAGLSSTLSAMGTVGGGTGASVGGFLETLLGTASAATGGGGLLGNLSTLSSAASGLYTAVTGNSLLGSVLGSVGIGSGAAGAAAGGAGALLGGASSTGAVGVAATTSGGLGLGSMGGLASFAPMVGPAIAIAGVLFSMFGGDDDETSWTRTKSRLGEAEGMAALGGAANVLDRVLNQDEETGGFGIERVAYGTSAGSFAMGLHNSKLTEEAAGAVADMVLLIGEVEQQILNTHVDNLDQFRADVMMEPVTIKFRDEDWQENLQQTLTERMTAIATAIDAEFGSVMSTTTGGLEDLAGTYAMVSAVFADFDADAGIFAEGLGLFEGEGLDTFMGVAEHFGAFAEEGEGLANTLGRVYSNILGFADSLDLAGQSLYTVDLTLEELVASANGLVEAAGGVEELSALNTYYFENFLTAEEQRAKKIEISTAALTKLNDQMGFTGTAAITSKAQLRSVVEGLDLTTEAGQQLYVQLVGTMAPAVLELEGLMNSTAEGVQTTTTALDSFVDVLGNIGVAAAGGDMDGFSRQWFQELGGGFQALTTDMNSYYDLVFSEEEKSRQAMDKAQVVIDAFNSELRELGYSSVSSSASLRRVVESLDLSTVSGRDLFTRIMADLVPAVQSLNEELDGLMDKFEVLQEIAYALDIPDPGSNSSITGLQEFFAKTGDDALVAGLEAINGALEEFAEAEAVKDLQEVFGGDLPQNMGEFAMALDSVDTATAAGMDTFKDMISALPELQGHWADLIAEIESNIEVLDEMIGGFQELSSSISSSLSGLTGAAAKLASSAENLWDTVRDSSLGYQERLDAATSLHDQIMDNYNDEKAAIESSHTENLDRIKDTYNEEKTRYDAIVNALKDLKRYTDGLLLGDLTPLDPGKQLDEAARQFNDILRAAQGGDADAMEALQAASTAYLEAAREVFASGPDYVAIFDQVMTALNTIDNPMEDPKFAYDAAIAASTASMDSALAALKERTATQLDELKGIVDEILMQLEKEKAEEEARLERLLASFDHIRDTLRDAFLRAGDNVIDALLDSSQDLPTEQKDLLNAVVVAMKDVNRIITEMEGKTIQELIDSGSDLDAIRLASLNFLSLFELMKSSMPEQAGLLQEVADGIWDVAGQLGITPEEVGVSSGLEEADQGTKEAAGIEGLIAETVAMTALLTENNVNQGLSTAAVVSTVPLLEELSTSAQQTETHLSELQTKTAGDMGEALQLLTVISTGIEGIVSGSGSVTQALTDQGILLTVAMTELKASNDSIIASLSGMDENVVVLVDKMEQQQAQQQEQFSAMEARAERDASMTQATMVAVGQEISGAVRTSGSEVVSAVNQGSGVQAEVANSVDGVSGQLSAVSTKLGGLADQNRQILNQLSNSKTGKK
jgi:TP901 family phage tail tape measure protein